MDETKYVKVKYNGYTWSFPAYLIAKDRAHYYVDNDKDTTYGEEFNFAMNDDTELKNWFIGDMNWEDVSKFARVIEQPFELAPVIAESEIEFHMVDR